MTTEEKEKLEKEIKQLELDKYAIEKKLEKNKLHLKDEKLHFLHTIIGEDGLKDRFERQEDDDTNKLIYFAYDALNYELEYEIDATSYYDKWYLSIRLNDVKKGLFEIKKDIMNFEKFIEYIVAPFVEKATYDIKETEKESK